MESEIVAIKAQVRTLLILVLVAVVLQGYEAWRGWRDDAAATERSANLQKALKDLEGERQKVFQEYAKALESNETTSIMHQQYHAANAQLLMQNLAIQQEQLLAALNNR